MSEQIDEVQKIVEEAKKPGTFNIINVLKERAYPTVDVKVYIDESRAFEAAELNEKVAEIEGNMIRKNAPAAEAARQQVEELKARIKEIADSMESSKYVFTVSGISEGKREELLNLVTAKFPIEYEETTNPLSGEVSRTEKDNEDRDRLFTNLLWREQISKITSPDGDVQQGLSVEEISDLRSGLPIVASSQINEAIEKVRLASAMFILSVDEDFLAKS